MILKNLISALLQNIFPSQCLSCQEELAESGVFCIKCASNLKFTSDPICHICGAKQEYEVDKNYICGSCITKKPSFDKARHIWQYGGMTKKIIISLKYNDQLYLCKFIASLITTRYKSIIDEADIIAPVPIHWLKKFLRKYNQSYEIIRKMDLPDNVIVAPDLLSKSKWTVSQTKLPFKQRLANIKGSITVNNDYHIKGKTIVLIDDVFTTGSTVEICSKILKKHGAKKVIVITVTRASRLGYEIKS